MGRGYIPQLSIETHLKLLSVQQVGGAGRIVAGVPVFSSDLNQYGTGFFSDLWSGIKSFFAPIGRTLLKGASDFLGDVITPGTDIKEAGIKRFHETGSQLLDQGTEALRRRAQKGSGRGRKRKYNLTELEDSMYSISPKQRCKTLSYIPCPKPKKRSVGKKRKPRKQQQGRVQKKRKVTRGKVKKRKVKKQVKRKVTTTTRTTKRKKPRKQKGKGILGF